MTLGIARPAVPSALPQRPSATTPPSYAAHGEDPARIRATIARAPLFAALPITAIEDLTSRVTVRKVSVGSAVVAQDEPGDAMFVIMSGRVKVVMFGESGREVTLSLLRRTPRRADEDEEGEGEPPAALLPAPEGSKALGRDDLLRKLRELALGGELRPLVPPAHVEIVAAIGATLDAAATDPRYAPRRPLMLPQLLRAASDDDSSSKDLANIIARDPALVGSLLKLANGAYYRTSNKRIESIARAVTVLGTQGIRSLAAAALVQPVFRAGSKESGRFTDVAWEHAYRSGAAAEVYAFAVEGADPFAAQLLALVTGLAAIVVFRAASDQYAARGTRPVTQRSMVTKGLQWTVPQVMDSLDPACATPDARHWHRTIAPAGHYRYQTPC